MRVLHVIESMERGSAESMIVEHVRLAGADVESLVVVLDHGGTSLERAAAAGARTFAIASQFPRGFHAWRELAKLMRRERVTVVNAHDSRAARIAAMAALWARVPVIIRTEYGVHYPGRTSEFETALDSILTRFTCRVMCTCEAVRLSHAVRMPWAGDRFTTVLAGVTAPAMFRTRAAVRSELGLLESDRMVLAAGSLIPAQAQHVLIEAFHRVSRRSSGARLFVEGEGPLRETLEREATDLGLAERVHFLGARDDLAALMEAADVFALTSVREGLAIPLLEAMRAGCPAVATRIGGTPDAIADGETGWIVPPNDPAATADALLHVLTDRPQARAFAARSRDRWARGFTAERMVAETERWYRAERAAARAAGSRHARGVASRWSDAPESPR